LQYVAAGLKKYCRADDLIGRWGGDEFVLVLSDQGEYIATLMNRIAEVGAAVGGEVGYKTSLSISAGYAIYPGDAVDAESLLEKADEQLYEEKRRRKSAAVTSITVLGLEIDAAGNARGAGCGLIGSLPGFR
jgi:diguanylate cyclase (GGDEF)-like protein